MSGERSPVLRVDPEDPEEAAIRQAAAVLRGGGLVAFPTETVYGLGALGLDRQAAAKIFAAKGRPPTNPLILHVASLEEARALSRAWPDQAEALGQAFWPGPLTLVVPRAEGVPAEVCAGLESVAIRVPNHPVARALLAAVGAPVAAPSANPYTRISPTTAEHVQRGLGGRVDLILDGGPTVVGLESTLVSVLHDGPRILREGMITAAELGAVVPELSRRSGAPGASLVVDEAQPRPSPGLSARHYAPRVPLRRVERDEFRRALAAWERGDRSRGLLGTAADVQGLDQGREDTLVGLPLDAEGYARELYGALHLLEASGVQEILVAPIPAGGEWAAIEDRLRRATAPG